MWNVKDVKCERCEMRDVNIKHYILNIYTSFTYVRVLKYINIVNSKAQSLTNQ